VYDWKKRFEVMGEQGFLEYQVPRPGRGIRKISAQKEQAVIDTWEANPEYGPGQVRNQLRHQRITISTKSVRNIMVANGYKIRKKKPDRSCATTPDSLLAPYNHRFLAL
jgi:putative transposase